MNALECTPRFRAIAAVALSAAVAILAACAPSGSGNPGTNAGSTFSKSYGGPGDDIASSVMETSDGGFAFVGAVNGIAGDGMSSGSADLWFTKLDANGNVELQRAIGSGSIVPEGGAAVINRVRLTPDGGYVLIGTTYFRPNATGNFRVLDILVSKLNAAGAVEWSRSFDSGPWLNYEFTSTSVTDASAVDIGEDIWPAPGGGYWLIAKSTGNLRDTRGIGFEGTNGTSQIFLEARSIVIARLAADGELLALRRLTDGQFFDSYGAEIRQPIIRATTDGGAVAAFVVGLDPGEGATIVARVLSDGSVLWRAVADQDEYPPTDLLQTDDADDPDLGVRDGLRDDGFLVAIGGGRSKIVKLRANGEIEWRNDYSPTFQLPRTFLTALAQQCSTGQVIRCVYAAAGTRDDSDDPSDSATLNTAYAVLLDSQGVAIGEATFGGALAVRAIATTPGVDGYRLLVIRPRSGPTLVEVGGLLNFITALEPSTDGGRLFDDAAFDAGGRVVAFGGSTGGDGVLHPSEIVRYDAGLHEVANIAIGAGTESARNDFASAVAEIGAGSFVLAGESNSFVEGRENAPTFSEAWLLRFDIAGERVVWQRRLSPRRNGRIRSLVSSNGGVLAGGTLEGAERVIRLDANGQVLWQSAAIAGPGQPAPLDSPLLELRAVQATTDGGAVALVATRRGFDPADVAPGLAAIARLDATGQVQWLRSENLGIAATSMVSTADGGLVVAGTSDGGSGPTALALLKLDAQGETSWARTYRTVSGGRYHGADTRIVQAPDGGYLLGATERGVTSTGVEIDSGTGVISILPFGQSNLFLLRLDAQGAVMWSRVYGGLYNERLHSLGTLRAGGFIVAGESESLGDRVEAWLLKLGPDGLVQQGCNAYLGRFSPLDFVAGVVALSLTPQIVPRADATPLLVTADTQAPASALPELVTARQCLGTATDNGDPPPLPASGNLALSVDFTGTGDGRVDSSPMGLACTDDCSATFPERTVVTLTATADADFLFTRWSGCGDVDGNRCFVLMSRAQNVSVSFEPRTVRILVERASDGVGAGDVTSSPAGINCGGDCLEDFPFNASVTLTATPRAGSSFDGWFGCDQSNGVTCMVLANATRTVTARFVRLRLEGFLLTVTRIGSGTVLSEPAGIDCGSDCSEFYAAGTTVMLAATAAPGFQVIGWAGDADCTDGTVTLTADRSCRITFEAVPPPTQAMLTVQKVGVNASLGFIVSTPAGIDCGSSCSTAFATGLTVRLEVDRSRTDSEFGGWTGCDRVIVVPGGLPSQCEIDMNSNRAVQAAFPTF